MPKSYNKTKNQGNPKKVAYIMPNYDEEEAVGCITSVLGNGRFLVNARVPVNTDNKNTDKTDVMQIIQVNCTVMGRMRGRNKRKNFGEVGKHVLISKNTRTSKDGSKLMGEIMHMYPRQHEKQLLLDQFIIPGMDGRGNDMTESNVDFIAEEDEDNEISFDDI